MPGPLPVTALVRGRSGPTVGASGSTEDAGVGWVLRSSLGGVDHIEHRASRSRPTGALLDGFGQETFEP